jgi:hypothetical protein
MPHNMEYCAQYGKEGAELKKLERRRPHFCAHVAK